MNATISAPTEASGSPFTTEYFMVLCASMCFMAFQDVTGKWHTVYEGLDLPEPVEVLW